MVPAFHYDGAPSGLVESFEKRYLIRNILEGLARGDDERRQSRLPHKIKDKNRL